MDGESGQLHRALKNKLRGGWWAPHGYWLCTFSCYPNFFLIIIGALYLTRLLVSNVNYLTKGGMTWRTCHSLHFVVHICHHWAFKVCFGWLMPGRQGNRRVDTNSTGNWVQISFLGRPDCLTIYYGPLFFEFFFSLLKKCAILKLSWQKKIISI